MEAKKIGYVCLALSFLSLLISHISAVFVPQDNYLINCGSSSNVTADNRVFIGDDAESANFLLSDGNSVPVENPSSNSSPELYKTARVFTGSSSYAVGIKKPGIHLVRLHLPPFSFPSGEYDFKSSNFSVLANGVSLLSNFRIVSVENLNFSTVVKEFIFRVDADELEVSFVPKDGSFGFVSAVEIVSAPDRFLLDYPTYLISSRNGVREFGQNISSLVLETVHRINVGGQKVTPFNDTLWRTWIPDDEFLVLESAAKVAFYGHTPNYQPGGASREIAPDHVYMTARELNKDNASPVFDFNMTWSFPVVRREDTHFIRLHFCDIVSRALHQLYFNVYIDDAVAYKDLDLSGLSFNSLATPYYLDFVVDSSRYMGSEVIRVSVGPSALSSSLMKNAILNGVEIMSIKNYAPLEENVHHHHKRNIWIIVGPSIGGFVVLCLMLLAGFVLVFRVRKRKRKSIRVGSSSTGWTPLANYRRSSHGNNNNNNNNTLSGSLTSPGSNAYQGLKIPYPDIVLATNNFDGTLVVGSGGFGMVYRAVLRDNTKVAVKRGVPGSRQGLPEFHTEITVLSRIRHLHLVSLVGYCEEQSEMILVYEYMEKGTLKSHLYGPTSTPLSWKQRLEICIGAARGIHYLHTGSAQGIIHRDIKSTNILLDENYLAKVADFGLSRSGPCLDESHVSTGVKGSFGYLDPEYFRRRQLTDKSDVYSFGVVMFEILCARPALDPSLEREQENLGEWAMECLRRGMIEQIMDPMLRGQVRPTSFKKFVETAEKCLADYGIDRPAMGDVLWNLEHALHLQGSGSSDTGEFAMAEQISAGVLPVSSSGTSLVERGSDEGISNISTSGVFSQLMANNGR